VRPHLSLLDHLSDIELAMLTAVMNIPSGTRAASQMVVVTIAEQPDPMANAIRLQ
jgi:hypothetical protein